MIKVDASESAVVLQFNPKADIEPIKLINLLQRDKRCRMSGPDKLRVNVAMIDINQRTDFIKQLFKALQ